MAATHPLAGKNGRTSSSEAFEAVFFEFEHDGGDELFGVDNGFHDNLNIHRGLARLAGALAIDAVLSDQYESVCQNIQSNRQPAASGTHHKLVFFQFFAPFVEYGWLCA